MIVSREEAQRIASLARLHMDDATLDRMAADLNAILDYVEQLREVDVSTVAPESRHAGSLRDDVGEQRFGQRREILSSNAPVQRDGYFVVPLVIADE